MTLFDLAQNKSNHEEEMAARVRSVLTRDLLRYLYRDKPEIPLYGHCSHASIALFLLLGGKEAGYKVWKNTDADGSIHYWLTNPNGDILDPTAAQYYDTGRRPPYEGGRRSKYKMSRKIRTIIQRVEAKGGR